MALFNKVFFIQYVFFFFVCVCICIGVKRIFKKYFWALNDGNYLFKGEGKSGDRKANTNRSKHSETEQRRRSKINERQVCYID